LISFIHHPPDLFQIKVSHLYNAAQKQFTLILHIVTNTNLLELYQFLPLPIYFNFSANISITPDIGSTNLLAIGQSKSFQTISSAELHSCLHLGYTFFCKWRKVMETSLKRSCLGTLYLANSEAIQQTCKIQKCQGKRKHAGCLLHQNYQHKPGLQKQNSGKSKLIQSDNKATINPGYYIRTMEDIISAGVSETVKINIKSMDWASQLAELFSRGNTKIIHEVMNDLRTKYNREFDVSTLFEKLEQITANKVHWTSTSPGAMILITLPVFLLGVLIWRKCCRTMRTKCPPMPIPTPDQSTRPPS